MYELANNEIHQFQYNKYNRKGSARNQTDYEFAVRKKYGLISDPSPHKSDAIYSKCCSWGQKWESNTSYFWVAKGLTL